jgi:hypothetical protein
MFRLRRGSVTVVTAAFGCRHSPKHRYLSELATGFQVETEIGLDSHIRFARFRLIRYGLSIWRSSIQDRRPSKGSVAWGGLPPCAYILVLSVTFGWCLGELVAKTKLFETLSRSEQPTEFSDRDRYIYLKPTYNSKTRWLRA